jgi:hypothetical protein
MHKSWIHGSGKRIWPHATNNKKRERKKRMKRERREEIRDSWVIAWLGINLQKTFLHSPQTRSTIQKDNKYQSSHLSLVVFI